MGKRGESYVFFFALRGGEKSGFFKEWEREIREEEQTGKCLFPLCSPFLCAKIRRGEEEEERQKTETVKGKSRVGGGAR